MSVFEAVLTAFLEQGWSELRKERVSQGRNPNPTRVDLSHGRRQRLALVVYAWRITGEGKGRSGDNFRIQTTRGHEGELLSEPGRLTLGFGYDASRDVFAVFDGWTKRNTGASSSVHIRRALLDEAAEVGFATDGPPWDVRAAVRAPEFGQLLPWIHQQTKRRFAAVQALTYEVSGENAVAESDLWDAAPAAWLRVGDHLVLADRAGDLLVDDSIWTIAGLDVSVVSHGRYPRRNVTFTLKRHGRVQNPESVLADLTRRSSS